MQWSFVQILRHRPRFCILGTIQRNKNYCDQKYQIVEGFGQGK